MTHLEKLLFIGFRAATYMHPNNNHPTSIAGCSHPCDTLGHSTVRKYILLHICNERLPCLCPTIHTTMKGTKWEFPAHWIAQPQIVLANRAWPQNGYYIIHNPFAAETAKTGAFNNENTLFSSWGVVNMAEKWRILLQQAWDYGVMCNFCGHLLRRKANNIAKARQKYVMIYTMYTEKKNILLRVFVQVTIHVY